MSSLFAHYLLDKDTELALARRARQGDQEAVETLILCNQRLVRKMARRLLYMAGTLTLDDLTSAGNLGLIRAIQKYEPERGFRLSTYATYWVRSFIARECLDHGPNVSVSNADAQRFWKSRHAETRLTAQSGKMPTAQEIADALGCSAPDLRSLRHAHESVSLDCDNEHDEDGTRSFIDLVQSDTADPDAALIDQDTAQEVLAVIDQMHPDLRRILLDFFGFNADQHAMSPAELAKKYNISADEARVRVVNGVKSIRQAMSQPRLL